MKEIKDFTVIERVQYGDMYFALTLQHPGVMQPVMPGQFVEVEVPGVREVMLRRPISVHDVCQESNQLTLLIQIVGKGTRRLSEMKVGDKLNLVYPLGKGFSVEGERPLLVGGGAGIAPLLHLSKCYNARGIRPTILLGGRTASLIPARQLLEPLGELLLCTDDGSLGEHGMVTQHTRFGADYDHICTCGPTPMMRAVARHALSKGIDCELSLENMMACGIGACLCCVCDTDNGHKCVCKDGPVFNANELTKWISL
ncbi:MAG: dihydroorotate dehydrogenase electron transfer subunit [Bacteroidales bacterium]|nr:dihydroorotate dehydrogenase electron transfer subunit [Bacteroidales bacterium]